MYVLPDCPRCGFKAVLKEHPFEDGSKKYYVICSVCERRTLCYSYECLAIEEWVKWCKRDMEDEEDERPVHE